jgi:serine/threonine protein kinase
MSRLQSPHSASHAGSAAAAFSPLAALKQLVREDIVGKSDLVSLAPPIRRVLLAAQSHEELVSVLVDWRLLTSFQAERVLAGDTFGLVLGNYRVLDRLGNGSMGAVYRGEHRGLRQPVAIKVLPVEDDQDPRVLERFRNEIDTVARLSHPHIVAAIDIGGASRRDHRGTVLHYFVMEYLRGLDLERLVLEEGPLSVVQATLWCGQIASALAEAQRHLLVHRDIKPSNIVIADDGRAKLLDFGLAFRRSREPGEFGAIVGTIDFMAPEQFENPHDIDWRADLYSLGAVLFWCLTGRRPFPSEGGQIVDFAARLTAPPPSARALRPELPRELDLLIRRLLMLRPEDRMDSPREVARVLRKFATA